MHLYILMFSHSVIFYFLLSFMPQSTKQWIYFNRKKGKGQKQNFHRRAEKCIKKFDQIIREIYNTNMFPTYQINEDLRKWHLMLMRNTEAFINLLGWQIGTHFREISMRTCVNSLKNSPIFHLENSFLFIYILRK